ncbi:hypothetical protein [Halomicrobium urmianum]|uniref:hypothetical protein n=1 Tax=Halomicrobium urmianum TaxID=1586233 RepID=UPI001CDA3609|nr:hypothetical protein [Halomicrobium urmianum]
MSRQEFDLGVGDHLRPVDVDLPAGVYRVVGTPGDDITLLRVGDAEGQRVYTGDVRRVPRERLDGFDAAENPDENRSVASAAASRLEGFAWEVRMIGQAMRANPLRGAVVVTLVLVGVFGEGRLPGPEWLFAAMGVAGGLGVAYVGYRGP